MKKLTLILVAVVLMVLGAVGYSGASPAGEVASNCMAEATQAYIHQVPQYTILVQSIATLCYTEIMAIEGINTSQDVLGYAIGGTSQNLFTWLRYELMMNEVEECDKEPEKTGGKHI